MPKSIDVLIGLALVMLVTSMAVTLLTQAITSLLNTDGNRLFDGLKNLLLQLDPGLSKVADEAVSKILTHPIIADSRGRLGSVIHRDEFTRLLLDLASGSGAQKLTDDTRTTLVAAMARNGIKDPAAALDQIRMEALKLEQEHPSWASSFVHDRAIMEKAGSQFVAKINSLFDQTIDRVSARFTAHARIVTFGGAVLVAVLLQLDTVGIVNNLWMNDAVRNRMIAAATAAKPAGTQSEDIDHNVQDLQQLATSGLFVFPTTYQLWLSNWQFVKIPGVMLSALLLSLGAPFWYSTLGTLLRLRSLVAAKDDAQRLTRQTSQADHGAGPVKLTG